MTIFTIGHSTRTLDEFVSLLRAHGVTRIADIRAVPRSRRHPHFSLDALSRSLPEAGIEYRHFAALGGLRKPRRDSRNSGWRHKGLRGYADYMETAEFKAALDALIDWARARSPLRSGTQSGYTTVMCAEAVWWRCHRQVLADALVARGVEVRHIMSASAVSPHALTEFARVDHESVHYPGLIQADSAH